MQDANKLMISQKGSLIAFAKKKKEKKKKERLKWPLKYAHLSQE